MNTTNWAPAVIVLLVALGAGVLVLLQSRRGASLPEPRRARHDELEQQREALYALLREHRALQGAVPEAEWAAERDRLELEAARVLRDLDLLAEAPAAAPARPSLGQRNPKLVGALWGAGLMLFLGGLGLTLQEFTRPRAEGGSITGGGGLTASTGGGMSGGGQSAAIPPEQQARIAQLKATVDAKPDDADARNALGHAYLHAGLLMEAFNEAEAVVALRPGDPEARTHQAIVRIAIGDVATAAGALDKVLATAPNFAEALAYRGALHFQAGEAESAVALFERAVASDPNLLPSVQPLVEAAKAGNLPSPSSAPGPSVQAPGDAAAGAGPTAGAAAGPSPDDITGTLALDPAVASKVQPGDIVFLSARPPGVEGGPPTWVARLPATVFPMTFTLGPANAMLGGPTPAELVLTARIDRDGNARTKGPDDLEGRSSTVKPGTKDVAITLAAAQ